MCANIRHANRVLLLVLSGLLVGGAKVAPAQAGEAKQNVDLAAEAKIIAD